MMPFAFLLREKYCERTVMIFALSMAHHIRCLLTDVTESSSIATAKSHG